ncbi:MAG TPA: tetratricopeptide repeat protein [Thermoanaerobaculia bacterium]|jgi:tetratricopeptide (TPR) repeat protein|nr:tetratricopeptide repeat protein [Thermoanaerobaculia bacterium]
MKHHLSRKDMKRDEVREALGRGVEYVRVHERTTLYVVGGLIGVLVIAAVVIFLLGRRESSASARLADALRIYSGTVDPLDPAPDDPKKPRFATDQERIDKAKPAFEKLASSSTDAGQVANVYLGEIAAKGGDTETARRLWTGYLSANPGTALAVSVELNLLALDRQAGKLEEVKSGLEKQLVEGAKRSLPEDVVLYELATTLEALGRDTEAQDTLQRLVDDHPRSPFAFEARRRLQERTS